MRIATQIFAAIASWARTVFAVDLRSLAAFRIGIALSILTDLWTRLGDVTALLSDEGVLPRVARMEMVVPHDPEGYDHQWSLHLFSGESWMQVLLIVVAAWFGVWLLFGYRTRLATAASWLLFLSLGARNPLVCDAGDGVMRCMLFWAMFVPLGARFSLDALRCAETSKTPEAIVNVGTAALLLQLLAVYFGAAMYKTNPVWTTELSGVYYTLNCDPFVTRLGIALREYPRLMEGLTAGTFVLELGGPLVLLLPWGNRWIRSCMVPLFWSFHLGLIATMTLGLFPWNCIACWFLFIPTMVWDWSGVRFAKGWPGRLANGWESSRVRNWLASSTSFRRSELPHVEMHRWGTVAVGLMLVYAVLFNLRDVAKGAAANYILPQQMNGLARVVGLEKGWAMFAPVPWREDGWPIFKGTLRDGSEVNLWEPGEPIPLDKPALVSRLYHNQRWRRYLETLLMEPYALHRPGFADWLARRWNHRFATTNPTQEVMQVEIIRRLETTPPPGEPFPPPESAVLWTKVYGETIQIPTSGDESS